MTRSATTSSTTTTVSMKARSRSGKRGPTSASRPSAKAVSVDMAAPQPCAEGRPALKARKIATATSAPPPPARTGKAKRRRSRSSPRSNSRRASSPTTKKKNVISPLFTQSRRSSAMPQRPSSTASRVDQTRSYEPASAFTQTSAAAAAASRTAAPPVSVRRNSRSGVWRLRAHAVLPVKRAAATLTLARVLLELRQVVRDLEPRRLRADEDVLGRRHRRGVDERPERDVHPGAVPHDGEQERAARGAAGVVQRVVSDD